MTDNVWLKVTIILGKEAGHKGRKPGAIQAIAEALGEYLRVKKDISIYLLKYERTTAPRRIHLQTQDETQ